MYPKDRNQRYLVKAASIVRKVFSSEQGKKESAELQLKLLSNIRDGWPHILAVI